MLLAVAGVLVGVMSEILVGSIEEASDQIGLSQFFVGVFVVAIVGNAAEHYVAVVVAVLKDKMDLAVNIAIGSSAQIALFVAPVLVILLVCFGPDPMPPGFNGYELGGPDRGGADRQLLAPSEGESTWFEGVQLLVALPRARARLLLRLTRHVTTTGAERCGRCRRSRRARRAPPRPRRRARSRRSGRSPRSAPDASTSGSRPARAPRTSAATPAPGCGPTRSAISPDALVGEMPAGAERAVRLERESVVPRTPRSSFRRCLNGLNCTWSTTGGGCRRSPSPGSSSPTLKFETPIERV